MKNKKFEIIQKCNGEIVIASYNPITGVYTEVPLPAAGPTSSQRGTL